MRTPPHLLPSAPTEDEIRHAAYLLWEQEGRPGGRDLEIWMAAKARLEHAAPARARDWYPGGRATLRARTATRRSGRTTGSSPA